MDNCRGIKADNRIEELKATFDDNVKSGFVLLVSLTTFDTFAKICMLIDLN